jgi:proliferating cell nuclear antigen
MFEAKLLNGNILKKIVEAIKDVVNDVNIDVSPSGKKHSLQHSQFYFGLMLCLGLSLQAMDGSHVALVSLNLSMEGFEHYRADTAMVLGVNVAMLAKVMKLADANDSITLSAEDQATHLKLIFEN